VELEVDPDDDEALAEVAAAIAALVLSQKKVPSRKAPRTPKRRTR
jgi:hypothetical protein